MVDIDAIKEQIDDDRVIVLLDSLDVPVSKMSSKEIIFPSVCHHPDDWDKHGRKLYWYRQSKSFHCFSCGFNGDIFSLIQHVKGIEFMDAVRYVCDTCGIKIADVGKKSTDDWRYLKKFLPNHQDDDEPLPSYNPAILSGIKRLYPQNWLDEGISADIMDEFGIGWYDRTQQIVIPVRGVDGSLVGIHCRNTNKKIVERGLKYVPLKTLDKTEYKFPTGGILYGLYEQIDDIRRTHTVALFEAPKSVLIAKSMGLSIPCLGLFGWNCNKRRRDILVALGVTSVVVCLDRQYQRPSGDEFDVWTKQVKKIVALFKPYADVSVVWDRGDSLGYKDSPVDNGKETWEKLWNCRTII